ncbi:hypothetical protein, partial [Pseudomonas meliae]|uniref:hypothetical protein n=1 Tax=Pseudomonas meliae TaxID=86176 RepID=UPI001F2D43DD
MQPSQTATIGLVLNGEALVVRFFPNSAASPFTAAFAIRHVFPYMFWPLNQTVFGLATSQPENNCLASIRTSTGFPPMTEISGIPAYNPI